MASSPSSAHGLESRAGSRPAPAATPPPARPSFTPSTDVAVPLLFMGAGILSLAMAIGLLAGHPATLVDYHYHQATVAIVHLVVLGFILSVIMGATYQLVPVVLETRLHSPRLTRWHLPIHAVSVAGMVVSFWTWDMKNLGHFSSGLIFGACLFAWNLGATIRRSRRGGPVAVGLTLSLVWLLGVMGMGIAMTAAKSTYELVDRADLHPLLLWPLQRLQQLGAWIATFDALAFMHAHAHLGILGVFVTLTMAVAYRLVPMFLVSDLASPRRALASLVSVHVGIPFLVVAIACQSPWKLAAAAPIVAGLVLYAWELRATVRARRRVSIDWALTAFLISQAALAPAVLLGLALGWPDIPLSDASGRVQGVYGTVAILAIPSLAILGMLHKILPFLVWYAAYSRHLGSARTPAVQEMYSTAALAVCVMAFVVGTGLLCLARLQGSLVIAQLAVGTLAVSMFALLWNCTRILRHLVRPSLAPLPAAASAASPAHP